MTRRQFAALCAVSASQSLRGAAPDPDLVKAMDQVRAAIPKAEADPDRPVYHFHPPAQWNNDPNGTIYYQGWHHLFYQLNPAAARAGNQHWGHARSRDLVNWEHLPIALWPLTSKGERAIFSGGAAIAADGKPRLIYTSIGHPQPEQWLASPTDDELLGWDRYQGNPVLAQTAHLYGEIAQWRDPFMFRENGQTYMVCGGGTLAARAQVQLYQATKGDLTNWKHLGPVYQTLDRADRNFECPNLFKLDGKWVLIVSPNRQCEYFIGDLDLAKVRFTPEAHGILDPGNSYASNISVDNQNRTILWLWGRTNTPPDRGWASVMTLPRILSIGPDGYLRQQPAPEFEMLRGSGKTFPASGLEKTVVLEDVPGDATEIEAEFSGGGTYGFELRRSADGKPGVVVQVQRGNLMLGDQIHAFLGISDRCKLRIFLDRSCIEVYANNGVAAIYSHIEVPEADKGIAVFGLTQASGGPGGGNGRGRGPAPPPRLESLRVWSMKPATFSLDHFHV